MKQSRAVIGVAVVLVILIAAVAILQFDQKSSYPAYTQSATTSTTTYTQTATTYTTTIAGIPLLSNLMTGSVSFSGYPTSIQLNPYTDRAYLTGGTDNLTVIDTANMSVVVVVRLPGMGTMSAVDASTNTIYVRTLECNGENASSNCGASATPTSVIVEVDGFTNTIVGEIPIAVNQLVADPNSQTLYATAPCPSVPPQVVPSAPNPCGYLYSIDADTGAMLANLTITAAPGSLTVDPATNTVYLDAYGPATSSSPLGTQQVLIVNGTSGRIKSIPLDFVNGAQVSDDPRTDTLYALVAGSSDAYLMAFNGTSGNTLFSAQIGSSCLVDTGVLGVNSVTNQVYAYSGEYEGWADLLLVMNATNGNILSMMSTSPQIQDFASNSVTGSVYVLWTNALGAISSPSSAPNQVDVSAISDPGCNIEPI